MEDLKPHAESPTLEEAYKSQNGSKFGTDDLVRHRKGGNYLIEGHCLIESTRQDCYIYRGEDGCRWVRPVAEMEDGRFTRYGCYPNVDGVVRMLLTELLEEWDQLPTEVRINVELEEVKARIDKINQAIEYDRFPRKARHQLMEKQSHIAEALPRSAAEVQRPVHARSGFGEDD